MFTGIIEELGTIRKISKGPDSARLQIDAKVVTEDVHLGDSIAVNGVCLTVVNFSDHSFEADVMAETLRKSNLGNLKPGNRVNLERALKAGDRLGGHIVSGHIDGVGVLKGSRKEDIAMVIEIEAPEEVTKYTIQKGSIAIDGISLTVVESNETSFSVSLIPHTAGMTTLGIKKLGDQVNLEADILGKYVERILSPRIQEPKSKKGVTSQFLAENGFM